jgi:hypothetical protein
MLADPWINWCAQGSDGKIYALEVCDAVESDRLGYEIDGVMVSDFITPSWFEPTHADRVDFKRRILNPLQLLRNHSCHLCQGNELESEGSRFGAEFGFLTFVKTELSSGKVTVVEFLAGSHEVEDDAG